MKKILYLTFLCLFTSQFAFADCTVKNDLTPDSDYTIYDGNYAGQTFTACENGNVTSLTITMVAENSSSYDDIEDIVISMTAGTNYARAVEVAKFDRLMSQISGDKTVQFHTPFQVQAGQTYSWFIFVPSDGSRSHDDLHLSTTTTDPGVGGASIHNDESDLLTSTSASGRHDFYFNFGLNINTVFEPIPTMSQWGLIIFGLLMLNLGVVFLYKQQTILKG